MTQKMECPSEEELRDLYFKKLMSRKALAKHYNVSTPTIGKWIKKYDMVGVIGEALVVKKREKTRKERKGIKLVEVKEEKEKIMRKIEETDEPLNRLTKKNLELLYLQLDMTREEVAKYFQVSIGRISDLLDEYNIKKYRVNK